MFMHAGGPAHAHFFHGMTTMNLNHAHLLVLFTYPNNGYSDDGHIHRYQGITRYKQGHFHRFEGLTGPAIALPGGSHLHRIDNEVDEEPFRLQGGYYTTVSSIPRHRHRFGGMTGIPIGYDPSF